MNLGENKYRVLVFMLCAVAIEAVMFSVGNLKIDEQIKLEEKRTKEVGQKINEVPIQAKAVSVYNITQNKKIYGEDDNVSLPIASLAKIMTVAVALSEYPSGSTISVTPEAIRQSGDFGLFANEKWKIEDLAKLTLLSSANDGAYMLGIDGEFLEKVNNKVKRLGVSNAVFLNSTGLDLDLTKAGAFASAEDVNTMAMYLRLAYPEISSVTILPEITLTSLSGFAHNFKNTNIITDKIPNLLFSKTGFTDVAGGNLVVIFKDQRGDEIAVTILGSTFEGRFVDMEKIVEVLSGGSVLK
jgi:serine-type D-Ala-D-Ala carboxypeptidase (penicillin-binding protein 5/6)